MWARAGDGPIPGTPLSLSPWGGAGREAWRGGAVGVHEEKGNREPSGFEEKIGP